MLRLITMLLIVLSWPLTIYASDSQDIIWNEFESNRNKYLEVLSETVFSCVIRKDTNYSVFHGCIDWHSSVHGYWALLRASRYISNEKRKKYIDYVITSMRTKSLDKERHYLKQNKNFEMPYGRAWFLRLAIDYELVTGQEALKEMANDIAFSLIEYYTNNPAKALIGEYQNAEWALRNLYDYGVFTKNDVIIKFVRTNIKQLMKINTKLTFEDDKGKYSGFFSRPGNYYHLIEAVIGDTEFNKIINGQKSRDDSMVPIISFKNNHHLSINYSRAWGMWSIYKKTKNIMYRNAYISNVMAGLNKHQHYKGNYSAYGHWVPQFGIYAITYPLLNHR